MNESANSHPSPADPVPPRSKKKRLWLAVLLLPYLALCFPALYARATPQLLGFPFFYWYQFAWVILTSFLLGAVYLLLRTPEAP